MNQVIVQRWRVPAVCLALAAITFAVFGQTIHHDFVTYDDGQYVYQNPMVAKGLTLEGIVWAFSGFHVFNWHPLTWLSHMLDCQLYGMNPGGHHLTNVLIHIATAIALFLVLRQMTGAFWRSAFVAAVFAIHPLRVESVAWVAERKDVLSGLFFMLTIGAYVRYTRRPGALARYGLVMLVFALGLMCKPMLVTLPVVLLLLDYWPLQRAESGKLPGLVLEKLPLLALSAAGCIVTLWAQHEGIKSSELIPLPYRVCNALTTCVVYFRQMAWPAGLAVFYPFKSLRVSHVALTGMLLAGLSIVVWKGRRTRPWLVTGWLWYLVMLLPVVGIIQVGEQSHADRYTYLPQIGIYLAVTWLAAEWGAKWRVSQTALGFLMSGVLAVLICCAWKQTAYWKNSETLYSHALACTTRNYVANVNLGGVLLAKGRRPEAITYYQAALQINPKSAEAHNDLGYCFQLAGDLDDAITQYQMALKTFPKNASIHFNLADALEQKGRAEEAIFQFQEARQLAPADPTIQSRLAWLLATYPEASLRNGDKAVELAHHANAVTGGKRPTILHTLAAAFAEDGRFSEAVETAQRALHLAEAQSNTNLAGQIQSELKLYQAGNPFHSPEQTEIKP